MKLSIKLRLYYATAVLSVVFAVVGFSYNAWRLELTEANNNIRTASFAVLVELSELEQLIYAAHYDKNIEDGNPRKGWVKVGLIYDLSSLINADVEVKAENLKQSWSEHWRHMANDRVSADLLIGSVGVVREQIKVTLRQLD